MPFKCRINVRNLDIIYNYIGTVNYVFQVFDYELPYVYVSVHKIAKVTENATYECKAENIKGIDKESVAVELESTVVKMLTGRQYLAKMNIISFVKMQLNLQELLDALNVE